MGASRKRAAEDANTASNAKRGRSSNNNDHGNRGQAAKQLLKSLITLDSYEQDVSDNVQLEGVWNEAQSTQPAPAAKAKLEDNRGIESDDEDDDEADLRSDELQQVRPSTQEAERKTAEAEAFAKREKELDEALPPQYRKFRPRGYGFKLPPTDRPVRIYADGVFDLFHLGHMKQLEQAKKSLPNVTMIVGVPNDELTHKYKGMTVLKDEHRYESLRHCRWVDEVVPNAPWIVNQEFLDEHQIDYVAHDDEPYAGPNGTNDVYKFVKERGQFLTTQRTDGISTSDIITRIVKDYDLYLMRNFKRGVSRKELNVSWMKKNELDIKRHVNAFRESWRHNVETTTKDLYADLLAFALNAPPNSVLGRARDWVSKRIESHNGSPDASHAGSEEGTPHELSSNESQEGDLSDKDLSDKASSDKESSEGSSEGSSEETSEESSEERSDSSDNAGARKRKSQSTPSRKRSRATK